MNGIVTGSASTTYADNLITMGGGAKIQDSSGKRQLQGGGTGTGSTGTGSIYFWIAQELPEEESMLVHPYKQQTIRQ